MHTWDHLGLPLFLLRVEGIGVESATKIMRLTQKGIIDDVFLDGHSLIPGVSRRKESR